MLNYIAQGLVQGLSEFLPISSSGHLALLQHFLRLGDLDANLLTSIALHFGTLLAVVFYFRSDIIPYFTISGWKDPGRRKVALLVILGSIPTAIIGLKFKNYFKALFANPSAVCVALFATGLLLLLCEKLKRKSDLLALETTPWWKAVIVGIMQGLAITPGISRSGSTIATSLMLGINGEDSAKLSFFLMIPAVGGATLLEAKDVIEQGLPASIDLGGLACGMLTATITGFLALKLLVFMIKQQKLSYFSYYLFTVSLISLALIQFAGK